MSEESYELNLSRYLSDPVFSLIGEAALELGTPAFVVGGYVRDLILHRSSKDVDIVCLGSGIDLAHRVAAKIGNNVPVSFFKNFGTAMLRHGEYEIEFVGARKESYRSGSRKPLVEDGTLEDDQNRRDFTINALSISLQKDDFGKLIDPFNGLRDMENQRICTPLDPDITFSDDPLRMMRAIRFAAQLNFVIDDKCLQSISKNAERLDIVSRERITDELNKIILSPTPSIGFKLLFDMRLLHRFFPEMSELQGVETIGGKGHKDNFYHTLEVLDNIAKNTDNLWLRWAAILHDIAKPATKRFDKNHGWTFHGHEDRGARMVPEIFRKLKLPLDAKMKYVQKLVLLHLRPIVLAQEIVTDSAVRRLIFEAGEDIQDLMILCDADITSKNERKVQRYLANFQLVRRKIIEVEERDRVRNWQPPITGEMLMHIFDLKPGREIGILKTLLKDAMLDGVIENTKESALQFVISKGREMGLNVINEIS